MSITGLNSRSLNKSIWLLQNPCAVLPHGQRLTMTSVPIFVQYQPGATGQEPHLTLLLANGEAWASGLPLRGKLHLPAEQLTKDYLTGAQVHALFGVEVGTDPITSKLDFEHNLIQPIGEHVLQVLARAKDRRYSDVWGAAKVFCAAIAENCDGFEGWAACLQLAQKDRFSATAWFERDRQNLVLTDELTGRCVVELWDDAVTDALETGYLVRPRGPRPSESAWVEPLVAYAQSFGLLTEFEIESLPSPVATGPTPAA